MGDGDKPTLNAESPLASNGQRLDAGMQLDFQGQKSDSAHPTALNGQPLDSVHPLPLNGQSLDLARPLSLNGQSMDSTAQFRAEAYTPQSEHRSYLETGVNAVTSHLISDTKLREEVNHYASGFFTTASLFTGGKIGIVGTALTYGLAQARPDSTFSEQAQDFTLGALKGEAIKGAYSLVGGKMNFAPTKGIMMGLTSRGADAVFQRDLFTDPSKAGERLKSEVINPQTWLYDAAVWTVGEGLFSGINKMSKGTLAQNRFASGMVMGGSFGMINGGASEIQRQQSAGESFDLGKVVERGLIQGGVDSIAARAGMGISSGSHGADRSNSVSDTTPRAPGNGSSTAANDANGRPAADKAVNVSVSDGNGRSSLESRIDPTLPSKGVNISVSDGPAPAAAGDKSVAKAVNVESATRNAQNGTEGTVTVSGQGPTSIGEKLIDQPLSLQEKLRRINQAMGEAHIPESAKIDASHLGRPMAERFQPTPAPTVIDVTGEKLSLAEQQHPISFWRKLLYAAPFAIHSGKTTISLMAPLMIGDAAHPDDPVHAEAWKEFDKQLVEAKKLNVDAISTDVWWGVIEQTEGKFNWQYYDKLSDRITKAGLKWVPILSLHQCGGNVGDDVTVPVPEWIWPKLAAKSPSGDLNAARYVSEQGNASREFVSAWATPLVLDNYANVMKEFQSHFASKAGDISEINISLGPAGELRYPSYNGHDKGSGYPTRGALQAYSEMAKESFRDFAIKRYGGLDGVSKAWGIEHVARNTINPPDNPTDFFNRNDHHNIQYGKDFFDWYQDSLLNHGKTVLGTALNVFGAQDAAFAGIDIGAKIPGVHWRLGDRNGDQVTMGDRLAELTAGLIRTSRGDWNTEADGHGYRPILSMFKDLQPLRANMGTRVVPSFTALELPDGQDGPSARSLPHTLSMWVGQEAARQGLFLHGENALAGTLGSGYCWDLMKGQLSLPGDSGYYHGLTLLRMGDVLQNPTARAKLSEIINAINSIKPANENAA